MRLDRKKNNRKSKTPILDGGLGYSFVAGVLLQGCANYAGPSAGVASYGFNNDKNLIIEDSGLLTGRAINGYLIDAFVFQDVDSNGLYSVNEPLTLTNANGLFTLDKGVKGDILVKPINHLSDVEKVNSASKLAAYGINNPDAVTTYYINDIGLRTEFNGQLEISQSMLLQGFNITPLTTIVNGLIKSGNYSATEANQKVTNIFGLPATTDYIQLSKSLNSLSASEGLVLQKKSVAISNLLTSSIEIFKNDLSSTEVIDKLAIDFVSVVEKLKSDNVNFDITQFLSSEQELKSIISDIAHDNDIELNINNLLTIVDNLKNLNSRFKDLSKAYLIEDTGRSGIDFITADFRIVLPTHGEVNDYLYAITHTDNLLNDLIEPSVWVSTQQDLEVQQGYNTIFFKETVGDFNNLNSIKFYYDNIAPEIIISDESQMLLTSNSKWFSDDGDIYVNTIKVNPDFYLSISDSSESISSEFQLTNYLSSEQVASANSNNWLNFVNFSSKSDLNGLQLRLYSRAVDAAGNASSIYHLDFYYDNVSPDEVKSENVILEDDTGIYENDRVSNKLAIGNVKQYFTTLYDEYTSKILFSWSNHSLDDNLIYTDSLTAPLTDGHHWLNIKTIDRAGNESGITVIDFILDTSAPIISAPFSISNKLNSLAINFDVNDNSFNEWFQYSFINLDNPGDLNDFWSNINDKAVTGNFEVVYRKIDRAGNYSESFSAGSKYLDFDAPDSSKFIINASEIYSFDSAKEYFLNEEINPIELDNSKKLFFTSTSSTQVTPVFLDEIFYSEQDVSLNVSNPLSFQFLKDNAVREIFNITDENDFLIQAISNQPTEFLTSFATQESLIALGSNGSDKLSNLSVGDIFLGLGGTDAVYIAPDLRPNGISFLDANEINLLYETFPNNLTESELRHLSDVPVLKIYLENIDDPDSGGISLAQSDFFAYKSQNIYDFFYTQWNPNINAWFLNLGASNDSLYFGGNEMHVLGGSGSDILQGGSGSDYFVANSNSSGSQDVLRGFAGSDTLIGGDYLFLSCADFVLDGGNDNDFLIIGNGTSDVEGGSGMDTFVISPIFNSTVKFQSVITDFDPNQDKLIFNNFGESIFKGIFINESDSSVVFDLSLILGSDAVPYGSTLTMTNISVPSLLPEDIISNWILFDNDFSFEWSDLSIDSISLLS